MAGWPFYVQMELEKHGLATFLEARKKGNCIERIVQSPARHYHIDPSEFGRVPDIQDRFSSAYLIAGEPVAQLAAKFHDAKGSGGRSFRFLSALYPVQKENNEDTSA